MNSLPPRVSRAVTSMTPRLLAVAGLTAIAIAIPGTGRAASGPVVPPLDGQALAQATRRSPSPNCSTTPAGSAPSTAA